MFCYIKYSDKPSTAMSSFEDLQKTFGKKRDRSTSRSIKSITSVREVKSSVYNIDKMNNLLMVNPDCFIQLIIDYIYEQINLDRSIKFDLCDEDGFLLGIDKLRPQESGIKHLINRQTYVVVIYEKDENDFIKLIEPLIYKTNKQEADFFALFTKNLSKIFGSASLLKSGLKKGPKSAGSLISKKSKSSSKTSRRKLKSNTSTSKKSVQSK